VPELDGKKTKLVQKAKALAGEMLDVAEQAAAKRVIAEFYQYVPLPTFPSEMHVTYAVRLCCCGASPSVGVRAGPRYGSTNPDPAADGWSSPHTIVEIVNDDMQFLVDSVCLAINASRRFVHLVIFSILTVARDLFGQLREILDGGVPGLRESWMQIGITRESDRGDLARLAQTLSGVHGRRSQTVARSDPKGVGGPQKREQKLHQKFLRLDQQSQLLDEQMRKLRAAGRSGGRSTGWYRNSGNAGPSSRSRSDTRSRPRYL
jgi:NAD-specific glutamate dehydrogenase